MELGILLVVMVLAVAAVWVDTAVLAAFVVLVGLVVEADIVSLLEVPEWVGRGIFSYILATSSTGPTYYSTSLLSYTTSMARGNSMGSKLYM